ncbi:MAG: response regulator [Proteobacteria bacterium]|nr:MAG: response regulator [Pseudomonadota bacterium]
MMKKRILVVEDEQDIRAVIRDYFLLENFEVWGAESGLQALNQLKIRGLPDIIILDMKMPIMNGWEFAAEFGKVYGRKVPIIVATAAADTEKRAADVQAVDYIAKPFELDELLKKVQKHIL